MEAGDKLKMDGERNRYTVQGVRGRFILATKPFNVKRTYLYTLIDTELGIRGPINAIFGLPCACDSPEGARELFDWIEKEGGFNVWHVSRRRYQELTASEVAQIH